MPAETYAAWISLYAGVGVLAAMTAACAVLKTAYDFGSGGHALAFATWRDRLLAAPRVWLRWQIKYLLGAPVVLAIALLYAHHIGFDVLGNV